MDTAQRLLKEAEDNLRKCAWDFEGVIRAVEEFVECENGPLETVQDCDVQAQTAFPEKKQEE